MRMGESAAPSVRSDRTESVVERVPVRLPWPAAALMVVGASVLLWSAIFALLSMLG